ACADEIASHLHVGASDFGERVLLGGDGALVDPHTPRQRALALRARAVDQIAAVDRCRVAHQAKQPGAEGRVGIELEVDARGAVARADAAASTVDPETTRCVVEAARALRLPPIA